MNKNKKIVLIILSVVVVICLTICAILFINQQSPTERNKEDKDNKDKGDITYFYYEYSHKAITSYKLKSEGEKVFLYFKMIYGDLTEIKCEVDPSVMSQLQDIVDEHNIYKWNGFDKHDEDIMDGSSFKLEITYENGDDIEAYGYEKFPKGYDDAHTELVEFLEDLVEEYAEDEEDDEIGEELGTIINFSYTSGSVAMMNHEYQLWTEGDKVYFKIGYGYLDVVDLETEVAPSVMVELQEILNEYKIYKWNGFNEKNEDITDGSEFKLYVKYDSDFEIDASGYMKFPKGFDQFDKAMDEFFDSLEREYR